MFWVASQSSTQSREVATHGDPRHRARHEGGDHADQGDAGIAPQADLEGPEQRLDLLSRRAGLRGAGHESCDGEGKDGEEVPDVTDSAGVG